MSKKTLYVHIGMAKTGTTAVQRFLWENRKLLNEKGYCFPSMKCAYFDPTGVIPEQRNGHFLVHNKKDEKIYRTGMDEVVRLFETYDNILLSEEVIWASTYDQVLWKRLLADSKKHGFEVKILVYLRRQDQYIMSLYRQKIKSRALVDCQLTWEEFITDNMPKSRQLDYFEKLGRIQDVLGREALIVCRYGRDVFYGGTVYADFLHRIGLEYTDEYTLTREEANKSLYGNTTEMKRILNGIERFDDGDRLFVRRILYADSEISKKQVKGELFSGVEAAEFLKTYEESNEKVAQIYFGGGGEPLFEPVDENIPKYDRNNPYMIEDVLRFAAIGMTFLRQEDEKQKKQIESLQKKTEHLQKQVSGLNATRDKLHHPLRTAVSKMMK